MDRTTCTSCESKKEKKREERIYEQIMAKNFPNFMRYMNLYVIYKRSKGINILKMCYAQSLSHVRVFATPWTVVCHAPLSMGILQVRILEWVAMPSSRGPLDPAMELGSSALQVDSLLAELPGQPGNMYTYCWFTLLHGINEHNIVKQLSSN